MPLDGDIANFQHLLKVLFTSAPVEEFDSASFEAGEPADQVAKLRSSAQVLANHLPTVIEAAALLCRELPRLTEIGRKAVMSNRLAGDAPRVSRTQLHVLECLRSAAAASEDAFSAPLFQFEKPKGDARSEWHTCAEIIADQAKACWEKAGNTNVGIGQKPESPVVKITQLALEWFGSIRTPDAIVQVLRKGRSRSSAAGS